MLAALFLPHRALATTDTVFRVKLSLQVSFQSYGLLSDAKMSEKDLINLARGRIPPVAAKLFLVRKDAVPRPPANEVLALALHCGSNDVRLIVFDTNTSSNLATVATLRQADSISGKRIRSAGGFEVKSAQIEKLLLEGSFQPAGSASNNVTGGLLTLVLSDNCNTNHPLTQANATVIGSLHITVNGIDMPGMIKRGKLSTKGPPIGVLVEE